MKIYLIRHGETTANVNRLFCGFTDVNLTEKGKEQAEQVAEKLKDISFDKLYCSDLSRAYDTAKAINKYHNLEITKDQGLREINFGDYEGYTYEELVALRPDAFRKKNLGHFDFMFPNGESLEVMSNRIQESMNRIRENSQAEDVILVVVHSGVIRTILALDVAKNKEAYWHFDIDNCGIVELEYFDKFCMLRRLNG